MSNSRYLSVRSVILGLTIFFVYMIIGIYLSFNEQFEYLNDFCIIPNSINCYYINVASNPYYLIVPLLKIFLVFFSIGRSKNFLIRIFAAYLCLTTLILSLLGIVFPYDPLENFMFWLMIDFLKIIEIINGLLLLIVFVFIELKNR
ncbi:MAG: hypothetical protein JEZ05_04880 [Tenericutes bacterium]|nr:hypothetical protein [Mycoplasmatota bacterium]